MGFIVGIGEDWGLAASGFKPSRMSFGVFHDRLNFDRLPKSPQWSPQRNFTHRVKSTLRTNHGDSTVRDVTLTYYLFTPLVATGADPNTHRLPLLCFLHGLFDQPRPEGMGVFTNANYQKRLPLFVLRPGIQSRSGNWAYRLRPRASSHASQLSDDQKALLSLLDRLLGELPVDPRLVILAGASMGAYATWDLLVQAPSMFAVGIPMSGGGDTKRASRITARVWAFHSRDDPMVPVNASREIVGAVAAARNLLNVGVRAAGIGERLPNASWAAKGAYEGWTTDVADGLRYTELLHAPHSRCSDPMFDKGLAVPLFEWTLEQLRAAGFGRHGALR